ncbi:hypothetical protein HK096_008182 [Nowakowskiella sp. JEL0078]|nr:hypothetical protein HK096_008182 [Nowakowskiella sp. JEL0078]
MKPFESSNNTEGLSVLSAAIDFRSYPEKIVQYQNAALPSVPLSNVSSSNDVVVAAQALMSADIARLNGEHSSNSETSSTSNQSIIPLYSSSDAAAYAQAVAGYPFYSQYFSQQFYQGGSFQDTHSLLWAQGTDGLTSVVPNMHYGGVDEQIEVQIGENLLKRKNNCDSQNKQVDNGPDENMDLKNDPSITEEEQRILQVKQFL